MGETFTPPDDAIVEKKDTFTPPHDAVVSDESKKKPESQILPSVSSVKFDQFSQDNSPKSISESVLDDGTSKSNPVLVTPTKKIEPSSVYSTTEDTGGDSHAQQNEKEIALNTPTPKEKQKQIKQEVQSNIGEEGMVANRPQTSDVSMKNKELDDAVVKGTNGNTDKHYANLLTQYLTDQQQNDPQAYEKHLAELNSDDEDKKQTVQQQAFNYENQINQKTIDQLNKRGANTDFSEFVDLHKQADQLNQEFNIQGAQNLQEKIKHSAELAQHFNLQYQSTNREIWFILVHKNFRYP